MMNSTISAPREAIEMHPSLDGTGRGAEMRPTLDASHRPSTRVDGVDVAQLLRDIGEASAQESSIELFRLCLSAQRVLHQMISDRVAA